MSEHFIYVFCLFACFIIAGTLVLLDFLFLSMLAVYAFASKITPPKSQDVVLSKVEVHGYLGLLYEVFCTPFDVLGTITYQFPSISDPAEMILNANSLSGF